MIRLSVLWLFVSFLALYAWRDWYKSLCGLILLIAFIEHPDFPKGIFGVQGFNPWNVLFFSTVLAWISNRRKEGLIWDMPRGIAFLFAVYAIEMLVAYFRMISDMQPISEWQSLIGGEEPTRMSMASEYVINRFKWMVLGLMVFDGCRSLERLKWTVGSLLLMLSLLALQIIHWMPLSAVTSGGELTERSLKILVTEVGFHRVNLGMLMAGTFWAIIASRSLWTRSSARYLVWVFAGVSLLALAMTAGRTGYGTWAIVGVVIGAVKWRRFLFLGPAIAFAVIIALPGTWERLSQGFTEESIQSSPVEHTAMSGDVDLYTVTAGRNIAWPLVIEQIKLKPLFGYGSRAMVRTGVAEKLLLDYGESFPHPHSAYLQWLLDHGLFGFIPVMFLYLLLLSYSIQQFRRGEHPAQVAVGGICLAFIAALMVASLGSQTFYPREGAIPLLVSFALITRIRVLLNGVGKQSEQTISDEPVAYGISTEKGR